VVEFIIFLRIFTYMILISNFTSDIMMNIPIQPVAEVEVYIKRDQMFFFPVRVKKYF